MFLVLTSTAGLGPMLGVSGCEDLGTLSLLCRGTVGATATGVRFDVETASCPACGRQHPRMKGPATPKFLGSSWMGDVAK